MTQKEKLMKSIITIQSIKHIATRIDIECAEYSSTAAYYAKDIVSKCDSLLKVL